MNEEELRDFRQKYCDVLAVVKEEVVYIADADANNEVYVHSIDKKGVYSKQKIVSLKDISYTIPKLGYVNLDKYSVLLERHTMRRGDKYKKGFHPSTPNLINISQEEIKSTGIPFDTDTFQRPKENVIASISKEIFFRDYPSYEDALNSVTSFERLSCAFSSTLCIKLDKSYNKFVLLKNKWIIGSYNSKEKRWDIFSKLFNKELDKYKIEYKVI